MLWNIYVASVNWRRRSQCIIECGEVFIDITNGIVSEEALCNVDSAAEEL